MIFFSCDKTIFGLSFLGLNQECLSKTLSWFHFWTFKIVRIYTSYIQGLFLESKSWVLHSRSRSPVRGWSRRTQLWVGLPASQGNTRTGPHRAAAHRLSIDHAHIFRISSNCTDTINDPPRPSMRLTMSSRQPPTSAPAKHTLIARGSSPAAAGPFISRMSRGAQRPPFTTIFKIVCLAALKTFTTPA